MEGSHIKLKKQLVAIYLVANDKRGGAACHLAHELRIQGNSAYLEVGPYPHGRLEGSACRAQGVAQPRPEGVWRRRRRCVAGARPPRDLQLQVAHPQNLSRSHAGSPAVLCRRVLLALQPPGYEGQVRTSAGGSLSTSQKAAATDPVAIQVSGRATDQGRMMRFLVLCLKYGFKLFYLKSRKHTIMYMEHLFSAIYCVS